MTSFVRLTSLALPLVVAVTAHDLSLAPTTETVVQSNNAVGFRLLREVVKEQKQLKNNRKGSCCDAGGRYGTVIDD